VKTQREQFLGLWSPIRHDRAGHQPESDRRRARPETTGAGNAFREGEAEAIGGREPREGTDGEVVGVGFFAVLGELELVPEIERGPGAVEARPEVRGGGGSAHLDHEPAPGIRSSASGSLSPWPVSTNTTRVPSAKPVRSTPARAAADAGSQKMPSSRASDLQATAISSSVTETIAPPQRASASSTSARWTGV